MKTIQEVVENEKRSGFIFESAQFTPIVAWVLHVNIDYVTNIATKQIQK
jgi:hypothetical protein